MSRRGLGKAVVGMFLVLGPALQGCPSRIPLYAPRMNDTPAHRDAERAKNCADCHDPSALRDHGRGDDCTRCHIRCRGC